MSDKNILDIAINFIESNLHNDIGLRDVAHHVGYSYYHMTRIFTAVLGESVGSYINKRRLYEASRSLIYSKQKVIDIAMDSGFESSEAFSRAFKNIFHVSPTVYRKNGLNLVVKTKRRLDPEHISHISQNISVIPQIIETEDTAVVGIRGTTTLYNNSLPELWSQYMRVCNIHNINAIGYSVCESHNASYLENDELHFSVMIGSPIEAFSTIPKSFEKKTLPKGKYAVFTHTGSLQNLALSYDYIYGVWAMSSKFQLDQRESYEIYGGQVREYTDADNNVLIYIPVK